MAAVAASCLPPFLTRELAQASFKDMTSRAAYYGALVWVVHQLCTPELASALALAHGSQVSTAVQGVQVCARAWGLGLGSMPAPVPSCG